MTSSNRPRGRPSKRTQDRPFQIRVSGSFLQMVDDWRRRQIDVPSRAEAIRRMVELAIKANKKPETVERRTRMMRRGGRGGVHRREWRSAWGTAQRHGKK